MAVSTGADFAEVYAEHTKSNRMTMIDGKVETIVDNFLSGAGIRVCKGLKSVYACTGDLSLSGLLKCAANAAQAIASGGSRVAENGGRRRSVSRWDPRGLSGAELAAIRKRVQDGEKIRF